LIGWQLLTGGLALASSAAVPPTEPGQDSAVDVVEVASEPDRRLTVLVTIHDHGPYRFLIDTGAQATVLSRDLADLLGLHERRSATLVGTASRKVVETALVEAITLGSRSVDVPTAPLVEAAHIGGADGVLGLDALQGQRVLIDFREKLIHVAGARELGGNKGYEIIVRASASSASSSSPAPGSMGSRSP
jgi:predicted aspartyl protease